MPRVPRSIDHPDVRWDFEAARAAALEGLKQICRTAESIRDDDFYPGIGYFGHPLPPKRLPSLGSDDRLRLTEEYERVTSFWRYHSLEWRCVILSSDVEAKLVDPNTNITIQLSPGRNVVKVRPEEPYELYIRCNEAKCDENIRNQTVIWDIALRPVGTRSYMEDRWILQEETRIAQMEQVLHEIRINWLDWQDRVDWGHPVFDIEVDDLNRQCERAKTITDELDTLGQTEYREWFDVCNDG